MKKPEPLSIDGEEFKVNDYRADPDYACAFVAGARMNLSPYEAEELRDWLTSFLEWYYDKSTGEP